MRHVIRLMALLRVALLCHLCVSVAGADRPAPPPAPPIPPSPFTPVAEGKVLGGTVVFDMLVSYGGSTSRSPNADHMEAAVEHALGQVDFTQGRRLQLGQSVAQPIKSVVVERLAEKATAYSDTFQITVEGFGPLLQRISSVIRTFDFLKSVADKLRADGRTSVNRATNAYSPLRVE